MTLQSLPVELLVMNIIAHFRDRKHPCEQTQRLNGLICVAKWIKRIFDNNHDLLWRVLGRPRPRFEPLSAAAGETQTTAFGIFHRGQTWEVRAYSVGRGPKPKPATLGTEDEIAHVPVRVDMTYVTPTFTLPSEIRAACNGTMIVWIEPDSGDLYSCGFAGSGNLGYGDGESYGTRPRRVMNTTGKTFRAIASGVHHSAAISTDDQLYVWGSNTCGQCAKGLGPSSPKNLLKPYRICFNVKFVAAGLKHTILATNDDEILVFGSNCRGQLGLSPHLKASSYMIPVRGLPKLNVAGSLVGVFSNHYSNFVVYEKAIYAFGYAGTAGILGIDMNMPEVATYFTASNAWCVTDPIKVSVPELDGDERWAGLTTGVSHTKAWTTKGRWFGWGHFGTQIHTEPRDLSEMSRHLDLKPIKEVAVGNFHTVVIDEEGTIATYGSNQFGQCGRKHGGLQDGGGIVQIKPENSIFKMQKPPSLTPFVDLDVHRGVEVA